MATYAPGMPYQSPDPYYPHVGFVHPHPPFTPPQPQPSAYYASNDGHRGHFMFPEPQVNAGYPSSYAPHDGFYGPPPKFPEPQIPSYGHPSGDHQPVFEQPSPFGQAQASGAYAPNFNEGGSHGGYSSFGNNDYGLPPEAPGYQMASQVNAYHPTPTATPGPLPNPPQAASSQGIYSSPGGSGNGPPRPDSTTQSIYSSVGDGHGGGYGSGKTEDTIKLRSAPIFLLKRKVSSMLLLAASHVAGDDGTHWALEVNEHPYHIMPLKDGTIELTHEPVEGVVERREVGKTTCSHREIVEIFEELLKVNPEMRYDVLANNCRHAVVSLWFNIRDTWPSIDKLEALLEDGNVVMSDLTFLEHRLERHFDQDVGRLLRNLHGWYQGRHTSSH